MSVPAAMVDTGLNAIKGILGMFFPDKTEEEKNKLAATLQLITGQLDINKAEAQSSDPLQHWRGGLGWVCVAGYAYNFIIAPLLGAGMALFGHPVKLPEMDLGTLGELTLGMLGLGGLHVAERIKGAS